MERLPKREYAARAALDAAPARPSGKLTGVPVWRPLGVGRAARRPLDDRSWRPRRDGEEGEEQGNRLQVASSSSAVATGGTSNGSKPFERPERPAPRRRQRVLDDDEALDALPRLAELGVDYQEQPLPAGDLTAPS